MSTESCGIAGLLCSTKICNMQDGLPPFEWTKEFDSVPHTGMPRIFDFEFERQRPQPSVAVF